MNQANIIVELRPEAEQLKAACEGFLVRLNYIAQGPCRLTSVVLDSNDWRLNEITINRRFGILSSRYWNTCVVLLPGHRVDVTIENMGQYSMMFSVRLELEYANAFDAFQKRPNRTDYVPDPTDDFPFSTKPIPGPYPELTKEQREAFARALAQLKAAALEKERNAPPPPAPTRFSELDLADEDE